MAVWISFIFTHTHTFSALGRQSRLCINCTIKSGSILIFYEVAPLISKNEFIAAAKRRRLVVLTWNIWSPFSMYTLNFYFKLCKQNFFDSKKIAFEKSLGIKSYLFR